MKKANWKKTIKDIRKAKSFTQTDFAKKIGSYQQTVSRWESGASTPNLTYRGVIMGMVKK